MHRLPAGALAVAALALAACSSTPQPTATVSPSPSASAKASAPAATPSASPAAATDWFQYHGNEARTGTASGLPAAGRLSVAWSRPLGGTVAGQPLVIGTTGLEAEQSRALSLAARSAPIVVFAP